MYQLLFVLRGTENLIFSYRKADTNLYELAIKNMKTKQIKKYTAISIKQLAWMIDDKANTYESKGYYARPIDYSNYKSILNELN